MCACEPAQRFPPPPWGGIGWGVNERQPRRRASGAEQALRSLQGRRPGLAHGRGRRDLRLPRRERGRKVHDHPDALWASAPDLRLRPRDGHRRRHGAGGGEAPHRLHEPALQPLRGPDRGPEPALLRRRLWTARRRGARARGLGAPHVGPRGQGGSPHRRAARGLEAAAGPRLRRAPPPAGGLPGRAHERRRPHLPPALLAAHRRDGDGGHHGLRHHSLPRRGRALPPPGTHPRRAARGPGDGLGAQARLRGAGGAGGPGPAGGGGARGPRRRPLGARDLGLRHPDPRRRPRRGGGPAGDRGPARGPGQRTDLGGEDRPLARGRLHPPRGGGGGRRPGGPAVRRLLAVTVKEVRQIRRDPFSLLMLIVLPAFMLVLYGFALNFDVRHVRLAVQDRGRTAASRDLMGAFVHSTYFDLVATPEPGADLPALIERRRARAVLVIPEGFGDGLAAGRSAPVQLLVDGADSTTAATVLGYARALVAETNAELVASPLARRGRRPAVPIAFY